MKKLLVAGCSHSVGYGLKESEAAWYEIFADKYGYSIYNTAKPASSIEYSIQSIFDTLYSNSFDMVLFQLTTYNRFSVPMNGERPFIKDDILDVNPRIQEIFSLTQASYIDAAEDVEDYKWPISKEVMKFFYEKILFSSFHLKTIINQISLLQHYCKTKGIKLILIPYDDWHWGYQSMASIWRIKESSKIDRELYIDNPFMLWLKTNYNADDYYLDNGFHLNGSGQQLFANEYFIPELKKLKVI